MLQSEGFIFSGTIDLFDAGPLMYAYQDTIRTAMESKLVTLTEQTEPGEQRLLICTKGISDFKAVVTSGQAEADEVSVNRKALAILQCQSGDQVRYWQKQDRTKAH